MPGTAPTAELAITGFDLVHRLVADEAPRLEEAPRRDRGHDHHLGRRVGDRKLWALDAPGHDDAVGGGGLRRHRAVTHEAEHGLASLAAQTATTLSSSTSMPFSGHKAADEQDHRARHPGSRSRARHSAVSDSSTGRPKRSASTAWGATNTVSLDFR